MIGNEIRSSLQGRHVVTAERMSALVESHPDQLRQPDSKKALPLHYACGANYYGESDHIQPHEIIKTLLDAYPAAAEVKDKRDKTPLHWALELGASIETTSILYDVYPAAAEIRDNDGRTPLHWSIIKGTSKNKRVSLIILLAILFWP